MASVALVQGKAFADSNLIAEQLQTALDSRVVPEHAKGAVAQRGDLDMNQAFEVIRRYARDHNERLADVAASVVNRSLPAQRLVEYTHKQTGSAGRSTRRGPG